MKNNENVMISTVMREVIFGRNETEEREIAAGGQWQWSGNVNSRTPGIVIAERVLVKAGGVWSSARGLPARRVTCRKGRTEGMRKIMRERYLLSHPSRLKGLFFLFLSSSSGRPHSSWLLLG